MPTGRLPLEIYLKQTAVPFACCAARSIYQPQRSVAEIDVTHRVRDGRDGISGRFDTRHLAYPRLFSKDLDNDKGRCGLSQVSVSLGSKHT